MFYRKKFSKEFIGRHWCFLVFFGLPESEDLQDQNPDISLDSEKTSQKCFCAACWCLIYIVYMLLGELL